MCGCISASIHGSQLRLNDGLTSCCVNQPVNEWTGDLFYLWTENKDWKCIANITFKHFHIVVNCNYITVRLVLFQFIACIGLPWGKLVLPQLFFSLEPVFVTQVRWHEMKMPTVLLEGNPKLSAQVFWILKDIPWDPRMVYLPTFTYIYHKDQSNVCKYTSPMDPMGILIRLKFS